MCRSTPNAWARSGSTQSAWRGDEVALREPAVPEGEQALAERPAVERLAPAGADRPQREGDTGASYPGARAGGLLDELAEALGGRVVEHAERAHEQRAGREPRRGEPHGRGEDGGEVEGPEALVERRPAVDAAGHRRRADVMAHRHDPMAVGAQRGGIGARPGAARLR